MDGKTDYSAWSQESLIERVTRLEMELKEKTPRSITFSILLKDSLLTSLKQSLPQILPTLAQESLQEATCRTSF
jgi:hypothetical protein